MKHCIFLILLLASYPLKGQILRSFHFSECKQGEEKLYSQILETKNNKGTTTVKLRTYGDCVGNFEGDITIDDQFLNLNIRVEPIYVKNKDKSVSEITEFTLCSCLFDFTFEIQGLEDLGEREISVNNQTLEERDQEYIIKEEPLPEKN